MKIFSKLCRGLYEPLLQKTSEKLYSSTNEITEKFASRGFSIPPGAMYAEIGECYKENISPRAEIIFDSFCQAYKSSTPKPRAAEFSKELLEAIMKEQHGILASGEAHFDQFNAQFKIPAYQTLIERYKSEVMSEGRRLLKYYSSKADLFIGEATAELASRISPHHWYQRPAGIIALAVIGTVLAALVVYLIRQNFGLAL